MRLATLFTALMVSFAVLALSVPANASLSEQDSTFNFFAPSTSGKKIVAKKRAKAKQAIRKRALEAYPVDTVRVDPLRQGQQQRGAKRPRKEVGARQSTQQINFFAMWQAWIAPVAHPQPRVPRVRRARVAEGSVPHSPFMPFHHADLSSEYPIKQYAPPPTSSSRRLSPLAARTRIPALFGSSDIVSEARRWIGTNPTKMGRLWCARFMNLVLERSGYSGTGSDAARSFANYGHRVPGPQIGAIVVLSRGRNGGHVGVVSGIDPSGNPIVISGNHGRKVGEGIYPRSRVLAYVRPI